ncbi:hypothetical protein ACYPKM_03975 [Pseudomonas aeruginosa]
MNITQAIIHLRDQYIQKGISESYFDINNGYCEDFAIEALKLVTIDREHFRDLQGEELMVFEEQVWDWPLLDQHWTKVKAPIGLTREDVDAIDFGCHIFIADQVNCRFYDAESPLGVDNLFDLPLYRRYVIEKLRLKGIPTPDIEVEDVIPAPRCTVPNPISRHKREISPTP